MNVASSPIMFLRLVSVTRCQINVAFRLVTVACYPINVAYRLVTVACCPINVVFRLVTVVCSINVVFRLVIVSCCPINVVFRLVTVACCPINVAYTLLAAIVDPCRTFLLPQTWSVCDIDTKRLRHHMDRQAEQQTQRQTDFSKQEHSQTQTYKGMHTDMSSVSLVAYSPSEMEKKKTLSETGQKVTQENTKSDQFHKKQTHPSLQHGTDTKHAPLQRRNGSSRSCCQQTASQTRHFTMLHVRSNRPPHHN